MANKTEIGIGGLLILLILGFAGLVVGNAFSHPSLPVSPTPQVQTTPQPTAGTDRGLQLQVIKLTPTSGVAGCLADNPQSDATNCSCPNIDPANTEPGYAYTPVQEPKCTLQSCDWYSICQTTQGCQNNAKQCWVNYHGLQTGVGCDINKLHQLLADGKPHCIGKPVIYLYPESPTYVDVTLQLSGEITRSIPTYTKNGWRHVLAQPSGTLTYNGGTYSELFYESNVPNFIAPTTGIIIEKNQLQAKLGDIVTKLGLLPNERDEFLAYWVPKLETLDGPYIFFSIFPKVNKEQFDNVLITPQPKTRIEFLAYFKPMQQMTNITPLKLPATPPKRLGFTEVEWGGTIDE